MAEQSNPEHSATAFERVQLARHPERPHTLDFVERLFEDFVEVHGDRRYADDPAIVCGLARFHGMPVTVIGHQKGRDTKQRQFRNFGMPEAIAYNLREMVKLGVPVIVTVIGEGGSGGALAIGVGDQVLMLENAIYSVISPEGCAAILWKDSSEARRAAEELKLTAQDLHREGIVDEVIKEPDGGAQTSFDETSRLVDASLCARLAESVTHNTEERLARRYQKLRGLGKWGTSEPGLAT